LTCAGLLALLFGGLGSTIIGVFLARALNDKRRYQTVQVTDRLRVTTPRSEPPIVFPPVQLGTTSIRVLPAPSSGSIAGVLTNKKPTYVFTPPVPQTLNLTTWPSASEPASYVWNSNDFTVGVPSPYANLGSPVKTPAIAPASEPFFNASFNFSPQATSLVTFNEGAIGLVGNDKFVYADKNEGVALASSFNPDKWEEAEFRRTESEIVFRLRKKPGSK